MTVLWQQGVTVEELPVDLSDEEYDIILEAGQLTPEESHNGPPGGALYKVPDLDEFVIGGEKAMLWMSYHLAFFAMGVAGWACFYYLKPPAAGGSCSMLFEVFVCWCARVVHDSHSKTGSVFGGVCCLHPCFCCVLRVYGTLLLVYKCKIR